MSDRFAACVASIVGARAEPQRLPARARNSTEPSPSSIPNRGVEGRPSRPTRPPGRSCTSQSPTRKPWSWRASLALASSCRPSIDACPLTSPRPGGRRGRLCSAEESRRASRVRRPSRGGMALDGRGREEVFSRGRRRRPRHRGRGASGHRRRARTARASRRTRPRPRDRAAWRGASRRSGRASGSPTGENLGRERLPVQWAPAQSAPCTPPVFKMGGSALRSRSGKAMLAVKGTSATTPRRSSLVWRRRL